MIILATSGTTTNMLYNTLSQHFDVLKVIIEPPISKRKFLSRRIKKLGLLKVIGQMMFLIFIVPLLKLKSKQRIKQIISNYNYASHPIPKEKQQEVSTVNSKTTIKLVDTLKPDFIFINGTRIISSQILELLSTKLINIHVGITPKYRGVHGGYWALYSEESQLFGTTLHYVNAGIDTGQIINQKTTTISNKDNFVTYPIIQYCLGLELIEANLDKIIANETLPFKALTSESQLHYHPTFTQYLLRRIRRGLK